MNEQSAKFVSRIAAVIITLMLVVRSVSAQEEIQSYFQDFEAGWPAEWESESGWEIIEGEKGLSMVGQGHNWTSLSNGSWDDYRFRFLVKLENNAYLHANFRFSSGGNRYFIGINKNNLYISKQTGPNTFHENLASAPGIGSGWHMIEITGSGPEITVYVNEQKVMGYTDPNPIFSGGISFESLTEDLVRIDDVEIWNQDQGPHQDPEIEAQNDGSLSWVRLGGPPGGLGYDIRYNFDDPNIWYVTDANAGVHISTDNGLTWQQNNQGIDTVGGPAGDGIPIFSLTIDPNDPQIIWIGTDHTGDIYKSVDGGNTWQKKSNGIIQEYEILISFRGFTVHPQNSMIVYAMGELQKPGNNVWGLGVGGVVYKTIDGGENWSRIWYGKIPASLARYMWINPENPQVLYVSTGIFDRGSVGETDPETDPTPFGGLGVLKSTDGGQSWRVLGEENGLDFRYIGSLFMHPENPEVLFAAAGHVVPELASQRMTEEGNSPLGIYRTTDGGESWQQVLKPSGDILVQTFSAVDICPSDPDIIYAGSDIAIYQSVDGGDNWALMTGGTSGWGPPGVRAGWPIDLQCDPRNSDRVFTNNYSGGNFLSEDGGRTWINASTGYSGAQIIGIAVDPFNPARVYAAGRSGAWYSTDAGATWNGIHNPGDNRAMAGGEWGGVAFDPMNQDHVILGSEHFLNWNPEENRWIESSVNPGYGPETSEIEFAPSDPNIVYAVSANHNSMIHAYNYETGRGIVISKDSGYTWEVITGEQFSDSVLTDVSIDHFDPKIVYVASQNGLFRSIDSGGSWTDLVITSPGSPVRTIAVHPSDSNKLIAGLPGSGVYLSLDGGESWNQTYAGLEPNGDYRDIIFDPINPDIVYLSDITSGIFRSTDQGRSWFKLSQGLTNRATTSLSISSDGQHLYAATSGSGVFRLDINGTPPKAVQTEVQTHVDNQEGSEQTSQDKPGQESNGTENTEEKETESGPRLLPCLGGLVPLAITGLIVLRRKD